MFGFAINLNKCKFTIVKNFVDSSKGHLRKKDQTKREKN